MSYISCARVHILQRKHDRQGNAHTLDNRNVLVSYKRLFNFKVVQSEATTTLVATVSWADIGPKSADIGPKSEW